MPRAPRTLLPAIAAIDVGTNAVRLEIARVRPDGSLETLHHERHTIRPGEGMFSTGAMPEPVLQRLVSTLRRFAAICRRSHARVRAVATSAVREARNRREIVRRVEDETGIRLEVISGSEEARLVCLGVLHDRPKSARSLVIDIGGGSTEIATAVGDRPTHLWSVALGSVRMTELFGADGRPGRWKADLMRRYAAESLARGVPRNEVPQFRSAFGSSGTINAIVSFAADEDAWPRASAARLTRAVDALADMTLAQRMEHFDPRRAEIVVGGAVVLEQVVKHLGLESVVAVNRGLRHGVLFDMLRSGAVSPEDRSLADGAEALGQRFQVDREHARHVSRLSVRLFDELRALHGLPAWSRPLLEAAALLHDVGLAVNYQRHHKHSYYLIRNADLPGLGDEERELVALIARFHRRSAPEPGHRDLEGLDAGGVRLVRKLSTILRLADALDRGHHQAVRDVRAKVKGRKVALRLVARAPVDLEVWDAEREAGVFRRVFGRRLELALARG